MPVLFAVHFWRLILNVYQLAFVLRCGFFVTFIRIIYNIYTPELTHIKQHNTPSMSLLEQERLSEKNTIL